ncbi:MAG TPA: GH1 family beta-glucosidase [Acidimicrobiales bacterium]|nr:GH1 family beta-glucosidase [Acidimicrobiales bacterium]
MRRFPPDFLWGVATSAYQIEGGVDMDGRGPSIWDTFCAQPGKVRGGNDGRTAADHRRRMAEDVALLRHLGVGAYRFSVAWPRVQPSGRDAVSASGVDFYRSLVDALLEAGIEPVVTLYHWDLPQALEEEGGWPVRDTASRFAEYAAAMGLALGDRVRRWSTVCEPWCVSMLGYASGVHAPGRTDPGAAVAAAHHLLVGHGLAVDALRATVGSGAEVAITLNPYPVVTAGGSDREADADAARRVDGVANRLWYDAVLLGRYPEDVMADFASVSDLAHIRDGDLAVISRPLDALGVNYYRRHHVRFAPGASAGPPTSTWPGSADVELVDPGVATTASGWAIEPDGLLETLRRLTSDYDPPPVYVHESGAAFDDHADEDGYVQDDDRLTYLRDHVRGAHDAVSQGVDLRGFFVWSLLDNFEWAEGYSKRFGIVRVDFESQRRTPKASAGWYAEVAGTGVVD